MYNINLAPWRKQRFKKYIVFALLINVMLWALCLVFYVSYKQYLNIPEKRDMVIQLNTQINFTKNQLSRLKAQANTLANLQRIKKVNADLLDTLIQLSHMIPANTRLDLINITPDEMTLIGQAANQAEMTNLSQQVFNLAYFNKQKSWTISERPRNVDFKLVLKHESEDLNSI